MKNFLRKLKLVNNFSLELDVDKNTFAQNFKSHVDPGEFGIFSRMFEVFESSDNMYKGYVGFHDFKIRRRRKMFDMAMSYLATAFGTFNERNGKLVVDVELMGLSKFMYPFFIVVPFFYLIFLVGMVSIGLSEDDSSFLLFMIPFLLLHASFMMGIPYFMMRRTMKNLKHELEREFFYYTKK